MKKLLVSVLALSVMVAPVTMAQVMPPPHNAPRTPVSREVLPGSKAPIPSTHEVQGQATVIDGEKLRIGDTDIRLFGIVPPQLSANFGPQARTALDSITSGQTVACQVRDRDHDGRFLATCHTARSPDLALELLRRGLAVTARGSLASTDLFIPYVTTEQEAQTQKVGLWSVTTPSPVTVTAALPTPAKTETGAKPDAVAMPTMITSEIKKDEKPAADKAANKVAAAMQPAPIDASALAPNDVDDSMAVPSGPGFFARYQILIAGFLMLTTAFGILGVLSAQRRTERREEMKAIAAALRGELMAARAVCQTRLKTISNEADDKAATWPRLRSTLYQAYVGRLGWLGAELARQVASIYGQASDYAAYYNVNDGDATTTPKRQALQVLTQYIEAVLPKLAIIEQTGKLPQTQAAPPPMNYTRPMTTAMESTATESAASEATAGDTLAAYEKPAASEVTVPPAPVSADAFAIPTESTPAPLWSAMRKFAKDRLADKKSGAMEEQLPDYTALIEEEMASMSFSESDDELGSLPDNVTKIRTGS